MSLLLHPFPALRFAPLAGPLDSVLVPALTGLPGALPPAPRAAAGARALVFAAPPASRNRRALLDAWLAQGVLVEDRPSLYVLRSRQAGRTWFTLLGLLDLAEVGGRVRPHEQTLPQRVEHRARELSELDLDLEPVPLLATASPAATATVRAVFDAAAPVADGWLGDVALALRAVPARSPLLTMGDVGETHVVADGHHRLAAALQVSGPGGQVLAALTPAADAAVLALHRVVPRRRTPDLLGLLAEVGRTAGGATLLLPGDLPSALSALAGAGGPGLVLTDGTDTALVTAPPGYALDVDVAAALLHQLGPAADALPAVCDPAEAVALARSSGGTAVLLRAPGWPAVLERALTGRLLPPKATAVVPKPPAGLVLRYAGSAGTSSSSTSTS